MSYSRFLSSTKGPLWVAAYCFKRLNKAQILHNHIPSSVDKILQDEMNAISYRVVAYLLLGVVRIYSKKAEYLLDDCNEMLVRINKFLIKTKGKTPVEKMRMSVIIPDRFELDAFDLDILEDAGGGHVASQEEITLKDVVCTNEGFGLFSLDKFEKFDFCQNICIADHAMLEDCCQSHEIDVDYEFFLPNSPINLMEDKNISEKSIVHVGEPMNFDMVLLAEGVEKEPLDLFCQDQDQENNEVLAIHEAASCEDKIPEERSRISRDELVDVGILSGREKEPVLSVEAFNESHQVDEEHSMVMETSSLLCQMHKEISEVHEIRKFQGNTETPPEDKSHQNDCMDYSKSSVAEKNLGENTEGSVEEHEKESTPLGLFCQDQDQENNELLAIHEAASCEDKIPEERSRISRDELVNVSILSGRDKEPVLSVEAFNESHQVDEEHSMVMETSSSLCQMHKEISEVHEIRIFQENTERPPEDKSHQEDCMDYSKSSVAEKNVGENTERSVEEHEKESTFVCKDKVLLGCEKLNVIPLGSKNLDVTPQSKLQEGSVAKPKEGSTSPEVMHISTPAVRECASFSRKRKIVIDRMMVLPNEVLKKGLYDTSDLVANRRKFRRISLAVQRESRISTHCDRFNRPLFPCSHLCSLFSRSKISSSLKIDENKENLDVSESPTVGAPVYTAIAPQTPCQRPVPLRILETPGSLDVSELRNVGSPDQIETAPGTPPPSLKEKLRPIEELERNEIQLTDNLEPSSPHGTIEREQPLRRDDELNLMEEVINSCETENSDLLAGWSDRTRRVARYLHQNYLGLSIQRDEQVVNFSQVLGGCIRKECARLFYEILVLKTTNYVDVKQNSAYGDILLCKLQKMDQTFGVVDL